MPKPAPSTTPDDNVVRLSVPSDTHITSFMLEQAGAEIAAHLPAGWFRLAVDGSDSATTRDDHIMLWRDEEGGGPATGHYSIERTRGRYRVDVVCEGDGDATLPLGHHRTMADAVQAVVGDVNAAVAEIQQQVDGWKAALRQS